MQSISDRLREERERTGLKQPEFAELGLIKRGTQVNYESGKRAPDTDYLSALYAAGIDVNYILTGIRTGNWVNEKTAEYNTELQTEQKKFLNLCCMNLKQPKKKWISRCTIVINRTHCRKSFKKKKKTTQAFGL